MGLAAHGVRVGGIVIRELLSHSRCSESDDQGDGEEELLHRRISFSDGLRTKAFQPVGQDVRVKHDSQFAWRVAFVTQLAFNFS